MESNRTVGNSPQMVEGSNELYLKDLKKPQMVEGSNELYLKDLKKHTRSGQGKFFCNRKLITCSNTSWLLLVASDCW